MRPQSRHQRIIAQLQARHPNPPAKSVQTEPTLHRFESHPRPDEALGAANAGLAINPNSALLYGARSYAEVFLGQYEQAISDAQQAMRLSPRDPRKGLWYSQIGLVDLAQGRYDAAVDEFRKGLDAGYRSFLSYVRLTAALALEGKLEEAKTALAE